MSRKSKKNREKRIRRIEKKEKRYYDANTLTNKECQHEIGKMKKTGFVGVTSSLAIGEAVRNILIKKPNGKEKALHLIDYIEEQRKYKLIEILPACKVKKQLMEIFEIVKEMDIADAYHLAIAVSHGCVQFNSSDPDLDIPKEKQKKIKEKFGLQEFVIVKRDIADI